LINNFVLARSIGICPFIGVSKQLESALGMGWAVIFVMTMTSAICWVIEEKILIPLHLEYLQTIFFILVIAALVQFIELLIKKYSPTLYKMLGIYLPLITTNCAVLGVALLNVDMKYDLVQSIAHGLGGGIGFTIALIVMAGIRERLETADIPAPFKGVPIALVTAALMSMAFLGFSGLITL
jgi:electron transport complex protein RnfA